MIDSLSKIAQGKFLKSEHQNIISPQEEYSLKLYAIQILVQMLRNINKTIEAESTDFKLNHRDSVVIGKREQSADNQGSDEEDNQQLSSQNSVLFQDGHLNQPVDKF
mmetsp:Transcript_28909/g.27828  ORF Transcript_28909/g.27828 Transcript_28909/m.27828 type:complete len:107 (+) Transcript_28909:1798-2118(+)